MREDCEWRTGIKDEKDWKRALLCLESIHLPLVTTKKGSMMSYRACIRMCGHTSRGLWRARVEAMDRDWLRNDVAVPKSHRVMKKSIVAAMESLTV